MPTNNNNELIVAIAAAIDEKHSRSLNDAAESKKTKVAEVVRAGSKLLIPEEMTLDDAMRVLKAKQVEEEEVTSFSETFDVFVWEGAYAMARTLDKKYGWFQQVMTPAKSFFDEDHPPAMYSVKTGPDTTVQVPWGRFLLPNIPKSDGWLETGFEITLGQIPKFRLQARLKKKHSQQFHALCASIREELKVVSLYKGKTVTVKFYDENGERMKFPEPDFSKIAPLGSDALVFSKHIEDAISVNLMTPLESTEQCREHSIPLKRGVMLAGSFGTGKTLVATRVATVAQENGWTYVHCPSTRDFPDCVKFAHRYQPAVVFCEDIDKSVSGDRDEDMDLVLNTIDGVDAKNTEIVLVVTTNEVEAIDKAMLRPGRFDSIIHFELPDAEAVTRLLRLYAGKLIPADEPLSHIGKMLEKSTPAVIREVVERAKLAAISELKPGEPMHLSENSLRISAQTMQMHRDLMDKQKNEPLEGMELLGNILGRYLMDAADSVRYREDSAVSRFSELPGLHRAKDFEGKLETK